MATFPRRRLSIAKITVFAFATWVVALIILYILRDVSDPYRPLMRPIVELVHLVRVISVVVVTVGGLSLLLRRLWRRSR